MCVPYMEYGRTHKHSLKRARQTRDIIRKNKAQPAYSSEAVKKGSAVQVWLDQTVSCLKKGPPRMSERTLTGLRLPSARTLTLIVNMQLPRCILRDCQSALRVALHPERLSLIQVPQWI